MNNLILTLPIIIFSFMLVTIFIFYSRISEADNEYKKAKNLAGNIATDYSKKIRPQEEGINFVAERVEDFSSESKKVLSKVANFERQFAKIGNVAKKGFQSRKNLMMGVETLKKDIEQTVETQKLIEKKLEVTEVRVRQRIEEIKKASLRQPRTGSKQEILMPISIKKEKALANLTEYQIKILEVLASEGEMAAPQMKNKIGITREHTARLMRRLADEGYAERDMRKLPYVYRIREEAREIIK